MKTKEDSEVLELSSVSENGPGTSTVKIDFVDSSKPKYWKILLHTKLPLYVIDLLKMCVLQKIQKIFKSNKPM